MTTGKKILRINQKNKCYFCFKELPKDNRVTLLHHINHNHSDNRLSNRCLVHVSCHVIHHSLDRMKMELNSL